MTSKPKLLMFVPYSLAGMNNAPKVRAFSLYNVLRDVSDVTLVSPPIHYSTVLNSLCARVKGVELLVSISGRLRSEMYNLSKISGIKSAYIEAMATSLYQFDLKFLDALKKKGIHLFPYIRDLYWKYEGTLQHETKWFKYSEREYEWYLNHATALLFPSKFMSDTVEFPAKYTFPPAGDTTRCLQPELPDTRTIMFVGGISRKMGIDLLMEAMMLVTPEYPDAHCIVVGHGDSEIIARWKDKEFVTFITDKTYPDIPALLANTYVTVIPHPIIPHNDFAMPVKLFDYMSSGRPVVATNCRAQAELIKEEVVGIVTEDTPESLAAGILQLLDDRDLAIKYGQNAYHAVKTKHSWAHRAQELLKIMERH